MKPAEFKALVLLVLFSALMLVLGLYLLANFKILFRRQIKNELLRKNIAVWMASMCLCLSVAPTNPDFYRAISSGKWVETILIQITAITFMALFVFNTTLLVFKSKYLKSMSFRKKMAIILLTIIACTMLTAIPINYVANGGNFKNLELSLLYDFYFGCITGLVYVTMSFVDLERMRKMNEKELEVSKLRELKTKAELDALHSKINPHFLYNALNSIADLSITDGKKARKMTIALADLFRFSMNYSNNNYSTVKEEVEMTEVYLEIEKIRFEDQLNYSVSIDENASHFLIPRFILQPLAENAVKHGLKATGQMTEILLEVKKDGDLGLIINIVDNGPLFPDELAPGYGVKSVYDKLDLLFSDQYDIHFSNYPRKQVSIHINKLMKNEPVV